MNDTTLKLIALSLKKKNIEITSLIKKLKISKVYIHDHAHNAQTCKIPDLLFVKFSKFYTFKMMFQEQ